MVRFRFFFILALLVFNHANAEDGNYNKLRELLKTELATSFLKEEWPKELNFEGKALKIEYTIDNELNEFVKKLHRKYRSDFSSIVVINNDTGKILSVVDSSRGSDEFSKNLAFSSTHPSASIFKIVTAIELLKAEDLGKDTMSTFVGRGTTLYRYQLKPATNVRWRRSQSLESAFATSNNVVFGKLAQSNLNPINFYETAVDLGFNQSLMEEIDLSTSTLFPPRDDYNLAEIASGFNRETMMSPIHGAVLASIVANDGILKRPTLVNALEQANGKEIWSPLYKQRQVVSEQIASDMEEMMVSTVERGTARSAFRKMNRKIRNELIIGGKTGSISGGMPSGKRDWFVSFAKPIDEKQGSGISICVMNVNVKKWYVKSSYLAKEIMEFYFKDKSKLN